jgi:WD40 repeat protein
MFTGGSDNKVLRWDLTSDQIHEALILRDEMRVSALAFGPGGRRLVTLRSGDRTARLLWDLTSGDPQDPPKEPLVLPGHRDFVDALVISPDGRWLVAGNVDNTLRLRDLAAADPTQAAHVLRGHDSPVETLAISPDGRWLASGSQDGTVRLWPLKVDELLEWASHAVGRNFTQEEWSQIFPSDECYRKTFERLPEGISTCWEISDRST